MRCRARRARCLDGMLHQTHRPTIGSDTRVSARQQRPCACATAKKLAQVSREERAEQGRTGRVVPPNPATAGTRRMARNSAWRAESANENAQLRTVGRCVLVAWGGIEPPTQGFSIQATARIHTGLSARIVTAFSPSLACAVPFTEPAAELFWVGRLHGDSIF